MVGRSGSSDAELPVPDALPVPFAAPASVDVLPEEAGLLAAVPVPPAVVESPLESPADPDRRFIVGLSGSSVEAVVEAVVEPVPEPAFGVAAGVVLSVPAEVVVPPAGFEPRCGWLESPVELVSTGSVFEGFSATGLLATASGFTLP
jgi:hypothetical protein